MAAPGWRSGRPLADAVRKSCGGFEFFQLVRLLLRERKAPAEQVERQLRFRADLSCAFPGREVTGVAGGGARAPTAVSTPDYVVAGYLGPLPEPYTDWLRNRVRDGDRAMADFFDLFNHRFNALRFEARARNRPILANHPPEQSPNGGCVAALAGLAAPGLLEQLPAPHRAWLGIAGLLANCRKSAPVLRAVVAAYLGAQVKLRQLSGAWREIDRRDRTALGTRNSRLGARTVLGRRLWDQQAAVELEIGPLDYPRFCRLLPGDPVHDGFAGLVRALVDRLVDCRVRLLLEPDGAPEARLRCAPPRDREPRRKPDWGLRLGQTAWLAGPGGGARASAFLIPAYP